MKFENEKILIMFDIDFMNVHNLIYSNTIKNI